MPISRHEVMFMWPLNRAALPLSLLSLLFAGPHIGTAGAQSLPGTAWNAVELYGTPVTGQASAERQPHLVFGTDGRLSGADGCNRLMGPYTIDGDAIDFGQIAGTQMACPNTEETVSRFRAALKGTGHWRIEQGRLQFYGATGKPLAVFEPREAPSAGANRQNEPR